MVATVIAISQGKGGASKTTTSVNLAGALIEKGFRTALFDWDLGKPDAIKWKGDGKHLKWISTIHKENFIQDIEDAKRINDFIIFDTPPNYEPNAFKAILASDFVIIPTSLNFLDQENAKEAISVPLLAKKPFKILISRVKKGTKEGREIQEHVGKRDISFLTFITERNVIAQCPSVGQWVGQFGKDSDSHKQFLMLANEVILWTNVKPNEALEEVI